VFKDLTISPTRLGSNYVTVVGNDTTGPAVWYYNVGAVVGQAWTRKAVPQAVNADAVAYSPNFVSDLTMEVVSDNATHVALQVYSFASATWNSADYTGYPVNVLTDAAFTGVTKASLALDPAYLGGEDTLRNTFIGLTLTGDTNGVSGIYRVLNTSSKNLGGGNIWDVAYDGTTLVAGKMDSTTVSRSLDAMGSSPSVSGTSTLKSPGGSVATLGRTTVGFVGTNVAAGCVGPNSAFAISRSSGAAFNDVSFVDVVNTTIAGTDMGVSADGAKLYWAWTDSTYNIVSLWLKTSAWERILSVASTSGYIVRLSPTNPDVIYLAERNGTKVYFSQDVQSRWFSRTSSQAITDLAVEADAVAYVLNAAGGVVKSSNQGFIWDSTAKTTGLAGGYTITSVSPNVVLVGGTNGKVAYSTDGNATWTVIGAAIANGALNTIVIPAADYATSNTIYAASTTPGLSMYKWTIGTSTAWAGVTNTSPLVATEGVFGMDIANGTLYAVTYDGVTQNSTLKQYIPSVGAWASSMAPAYVGAAFSEPVVLGAASASNNALYASFTATSNGLWALKSGVGTQAIYMFNDTLAAAGPALSGPPDKASVAINPNTAASDVVVLTWNRVANGTASTVQLAYDSAFTQTLAVTGSPFANPNYNAVIGQGNNGVTLSAGKTYYWRVRQSAPVNSPWSEVRSFTVQPMAAAVPGINSPANGGTITATRPAFSWSPVTGTTLYDFQLSTGPAFATFVIKEQSSTAGYLTPTTVTLTPGTQYFWRVRAAAPIVGDWSTVADFVVAVPVTTTQAPPVTITQVPAPTFTIPAPSPAPTYTLAPPEVKEIAPTYIWAIIIIGGILVIAVIVLIVRTRRSV